MSFIDELVDSARSLLTDVTSLDVMTLSGGFKVVTADDEIDFAKTYAELAKATQAGTPAGGGTTATVSAEVVAFTHVDLDKDVTQFVKSNLTDAEKTLLESHREMVQASLEARSAFLRMVAEIVK